MRQALGTKLYYSIGEVADLTDLQPYTLRAWEKEFACLRPRRVRGKNRAYRERDIGIILLIKRLLYQERYSTRGVQLKLKSEPDLVRTAADNVVIERGAAGAPGDAAVLEAPLPNLGQVGEGEAAKDGVPPRKRELAAPTPSQDQPGLPSRAEAAVLPEVLRATLAEICQDLREVLRKLS